MGWVGLVVVWEQSRSKGWRNLGRVMVCFGKEQGLMRMIRMVEDRKKVLLVKLVSGYD